MTLTATVTKKSVTKVMDKMWSVTINMTLSEDAVEVLNRDYSVRYRTGDSIAVKQAKFIVMIQADIDKYKSEQTIFNAAALNTVVANVEASLEV